MFKRPMAIACLFSLAVLILSGCEEPAPPPKKETPPEVTFDPKQAQETARDRIVAADVETQPLSQGLNYLRVIATTEISDTPPAPFLDAISSKKTHGVLVMAHIQNGPDLSLPPVPLFLFEKDSSGWTRSFTANGPLSPFFVARRAPLDVSFEIVLLQEKLDGLAEDAQGIIDVFAQPNALYSVARAHSLSTQADGFAQRIGLVEEAALKEVATLSISYLENYASQVNFLDKNDQAIFNTMLSAQGKISMLPLRHNVPLDYSQLLSHPIAGLSPRTALNDLESGFWSVPPEALRASCKAIRGALQERLGLSRRDSAMVLWRMIQPHALFATETDYVSQCSGTDMKALLAEMGLSLPSVETTRSSGTKVKKMNKTLSQLARLIRNAKDSDQTKVADMMAEHVVVRDEARLLFSTQPDQLIASANDVVAPTLPPEEAAQFLMMLPLEAYGCYGRGNGQRGDHRTTLTQLENDPNLWQLDFAFDENDKISGIRLDKPTQLDFCRAIGDRTGANRCYFSGKDFPGLSADRCR